MRIVVGVVLLLLAHHATAEACKRNGKVLFERVQAPLPGHDNDVPNSTFAITSTGAWSWIEEMPRDQEPSSHGGCLSKVHLKELERALGKAKFTNGTPEMCDAVAERELVFSAPRRKKTVRITSPCGETADAKTQLLIDCAAAASRKPSAKEIRATCRGTK